MHKIVVFAAVAVSVGTPASAQAGPTATQTTEQLVCQLSNDCDQGSVAADKQRDKGETRGFSIYRPAAGKPAAAAPAPGTRAATRAPAVSNARPMAARARPAAPRRAELMVNFVSGSAALTDSSRANAMALLGAVNAPQLAGKRFAIEGHTDSVGSRDANLDLSQRRAQTIVDFLTKNGVDRSRFEVHGYGPDRPLAGTTASNGRNRRVEVVVIN